MLALVASLLIDLSQQRLSAYDGAACAGPGRWRPEGGCGVPPPGAVAGAGG
jgi:hypothetical protein